MFKLYDVRDYGAIGDGISLETNAIQSAIDDCAAKGGGTVYVGAGKYRTSTIYLKSDITLYLDSGAVIEANPVPGDFDSGLIVIRGQKRVRICGAGSLYGNDIHFMTEKAKHEKKITGKWAHPIMYWALPGRPHMLFIEDSRFVDVEGIRFDNSPVYTGWIARSHHLNFMNLRVNNRGDMPNSDGFHFGSCSYVNIVGCDFICGDDCIAIDSCQYGDSHHFTITGCTFDGTVNVFRIFTGIDARDKKDYPKHDVHDISASSCSCNASGIFNLTAENGDIYNISMTGFTINTDKERLGNCAFLMTWNGRIYDCIFSDITARHNGAITIMGEEGYTVEKITFNNWRVCIMPMEKGYGIDMPSEPLCANYAIHHYAPYNMYLRYAKDIRFSEVDMYWDERGNVSEPIPAMKIDRCEDIFTDTFRGKGYLGAKSIEII